MPSAQALKNAGFPVKEQGGFVRVHPPRGKCERKAHALCFRSVVLDRSGRVVSCGWPKFFNQSDWADHDGVIASELAAGCAVTMRKHDDGRADPT